MADGTYGWPEEAPYDRIIVTAAAQRVPQALFDQLAEGGILVIPIGPGEAQSLQAIRKVDGKPVCTNFPPAGLCRWWAAKNRVGECVVIVLGPLSLSIGRGSMIGCGQLHRMRREVGLLLVVIEPAQLAPRLQR